MTRICFLNPFNTGESDDLVRDTLQPYLRPDSEVEIWHLDRGPKYPDFYAAKHLTEVEILRSVLQAEREGFNAFVIGCCYDPGLIQARELTDMPVIGPLESSVLLARLFGHRFSVLTDHAKAVPELQDRVRVYGIEPNCRSVRAVNWYAPEMIKDPRMFARQAYDRALEVMERDGAEAVVWGCTIIAACYEHAVLSGDHELARAAIINPNVMAVKVAEMFADLRAVGQYRMCRTGYYQQHADHDEYEAREIRNVLTAAAPGIRNSAFPGSSSGRVASSVTLTTPIREA